MPQIQWNDVDFLDFFAVEPTVEDGAISYNYEIERNSLRLLLTVWQYESVIQWSIFLNYADDALVTFAVYVRGEARFINDTRGRFLEISECIIVPNRFWYINCGYLFDRERFPLAVTVTLAIDPDIRIAFVNVQPRT